MLTPGAALYRPGQASSSQGLCRGLRMTTLLILAPKQPPPLVSLERSSAYLAQVIFTSGGHHGQRASTIPSFVRWMLERLCGSKQKRQGHIYTCGSQPGSEKPRQGYEMINGLRNKKNKVCLKQDLVFRVFMKILTLYHLSNVNLF